MALPSSCTPARSKRCSRRHGRPETHRSHVKLGQTDSQCCGLTLRTFSSGACYGEETTLLRKGRSPNPWEGSQHELEKFSDREVWFSGCAFFFYSAARSRSAGR